ncbi:MAG: DUF378 domain-containing protein [Janthinobacterium lividum]
MNVPDITTKVLSSIGAINWGLIALLDFNLVYALFGVSIISAAIYVLVGVSGLYQLISAFTTISNNTRNTVVV